MALFIFTSPLSALSPAYGTEEGVLWARTNLLWQLVCVGSMGRRVRVHPQFVEIVDRTFWGLRSVQVIPLERFSHIQYGYDEFVSGANGLGQATDAIERFAVALVLRKEHGGEAVDLFTFWGAGHVGGLQLGGELLDTRGDQEGASLGFVELLRRHTGLPMTEPMEAVRDAQGRSFGCSSCGRESGPAAKRCLYCGGAVAPM